MLRLCRRRFRGLGFRVYRNCIGFGSGVLTETFCFLPVSLILKQVAGAGLGRGLGLAGLAWNAASHSLMKIRKRNPHKFYLSCS